jgi:hypothetical protein
MLDRANPSFPKLLDKARADALVLVKWVRTAAGYSAALWRFTVIMNDGHAGTYIEISEKLDILALRPALSRRGAVMQ